MTSNQNFESNKSRKAQLVQRYRHDQGFHTAHRKKSAARTRATSLVRFTSR